VYASWFSMSPIALQICPHHDTATFNMRRGAFPKESMIDGMVIEAK
jgi:hypothetical protein